MGQLGPLRPQDIPRSAVDFHISNIMEELLDKRHIADVVLRCCSLRAMRDEFRAAIWLFSSSINSRAWLQVRHAIAPFIIQNCRCADVAAPEYQIASSVAPLSCFAQQKHM